MSSIKACLHSSLCALLFIFSFTGASARSDAASARPARPNVVLILVDDLGWQDVKCYDVDEPSPMETPNLDALAARGVQFWQAYSPAPTCAPSRAAILSGDHPARAQMTHVSGGKPPRPHGLTAWSMISPWYSARMPAETVTLAEALKAHGYTTGHSGKWHVAKNHHGYPQPKDQGFDFSRHSRGVQTRMKPDRLSGFATCDPKDPFRLDANGMPFDQTHHDAMTFLRENHHKPFFLYYATWLVHTPIVMRSEPLLRKYEAKLGLELSEEHARGWKTGGQTNPFYCAMVEQLDYYLGQLFDYLESTEDPRWPGHKLIENTYLVFTSDNGGMEGHSAEIITDNYPLDKGKISVMEGGVRVPLLISGPGIPEGVESQVMVNGLDFYPTILSLTGAPRPAGKTFDGCDLYELLKKDPADLALVRDAAGQVRDTMLWHFPNSAALESSIRVGDFKLVRNYASEPHLELYRLYDSSGSQVLRADIEEAHNLAPSMPAEAAALNAELSERLTGMRASYPYWNPDFAHALPHKDKVPELQSVELRNQHLIVRFRENGAPVVRAHLIYTTNGGDSYEEWFRKPMSLQSDNTAQVALPEGTSHYFINLIDAHNFLVSYPKINEALRNRDKKPYSDIALRVEN